MPTAWIFDAREHAVRHAVHDVRRLHAGAERPCARRLPLQLDAAAHAGLLDLVLYIVFFLPGIAALVYAGWDYAATPGASTSIPTSPPTARRSIISSSVIPIAGALVLLQGVAEIVRCVVCLKTGEWPSRLKDVAEIDVVEEQLAHSEYVDEESRKIAIERAQEIDETARQRGMGGDCRHERSGTRAVDARPHRGRHHDGLSRRPSR
jgi:hypothetical protein